MSQFIVCFQLSKTLSGSYLQYREDTRHCLSRLAKLKTRKGILTYWVGFKEVQAWDSLKFCWNLSVLSIPAWQMQHMQPPFELCCAVSGQFRRHWLTDCSLNSVKRTNSFFNHETSDVSGKLCLVSLILFSQHSLQASSSEANFICLPQVLEHWSPNTWVISISWVENRLPV